MSLWPRSHDCFKEDENGYLVATSDKYHTQRRVFDDLGAGVLKNAFAGKPSISRLSSTGKFDFHISMLTDCEVRKRFLLDQIQVQLPLVKTILAAIVTSFNDLYSFKYLNFGVYSFVN